MCSSVSLLVLLCRFLSALRENPAEQNRKESKFNQLHSVKLKVFGSSR